MYGYKCYRFNSCHHHYMIIWCTHVTIRDITVIMNTILQPPCQRERERERERKRERERERVIYTYIQTHTQSHTYTRIHREREQQEQQLTVTGQQYGVKSSNNNNNDNNHWAAQKHTEHGSEEKPNPRKLEHWHRWCFVDFCAERGKAVLESLCVTPSTRAVQHTHDNRGLEVSHRHLECVYLFHTKSLQPYSIYR